MTTTKDLIIECTNGEKGILENILSTHTLADLRQQIYDEFDEDQIVSREFMFYIHDNIRISSKQESKKVVWALIDKNVSVKMCLVLATGTKRVRDENDNGDGNDNHTNDKNKNENSNEKEGSDNLSKRRKMDETNNDYDSNFVTPQPSSSNTMQHCNTPPTSSNQSRNNHIDEARRRIHEFDQPEKEFDSSKDIGDEKDDDEVGDIENHGHDDEDNKINGIGNNYNENAKTTTTTQPNDTKSLSIPSTEKKIPTFGSAFGSGMPIQSFGNQSSAGASFAALAQNTTTKSNASSSFSPACNHNSNSFSFGNNTFRSSRVFGSRINETKPISWNEKIEDSDENDDNNEKVENNDQHQIQNNIESTASTTAKQIDNTDHDDMDIKISVDYSDDDGNEAEDDETAEYNEKNQNNVESTVSTTAKHIVDNVIHDKTDINVNVGVDCSDDDDDLTVDLTTSTTTDNKSNMQNAPTSISNTTINSNNEDNNNKNENAIEQSRTVLTSIQSLLQQNELFCSKERKKDWMDEITTLLSKSAPKTIVGVLGNTGVGKSSLLNALLDEASVLPTSGSRGCTAAVVELCYNAILAKESDSMKEVPVYRGDVEFITIDEWSAELKILIEECSTQEKNVYAREPDPQSAAESAAAWAKIDQVYGKGTMNNYRGKSSDYVFRILSNSPRVVNLLTPKRDSSHSYNVITVEEGSVIPGSDHAKLLVSNFQDMNLRMQRLKKKWAAAFRSKINSFVYRNGNGDQPQTWPLIRKVVLHGPWTCLSTGACLVDLPGVRDANAARARVSEQYLQYCNQIWIVAPIKRAVDDGTAKELLGEQFKRRLLMDGQYGNVTFICTQTDDCEATEIMRDHSDVAQQVPGRWEEMTNIAERIATLEAKISSLGQEEEDLNYELNDAEDQVQNMKEDLGMYSDEEESDDEIFIDDEESDNENLATLKSVVKNCKEKLDDWKKQNEPVIDEMQEQCDVLQRKLKTLCAKVRNEYSSKCLKEDFQAGLKDLYRNSDDDEQEGRPRQTNNDDSAIAQDIDMEVFCISANDYLKVQGIKPKSDGAPSTFTEMLDTQIPTLRTFVHETTAMHRLFFAKSYVNHASNILERMKLLAINATNVPSGRSSLQCMRIFQKEVYKISNEIEPLTKNFSNKMDMKVKGTLMPSLDVGAKKGIEAAMPIVSSWGSKSRRSKQCRDQYHNGLYWSTYQAAVRRSGIYNSASAGAIDMNQEICDPMEKEFSVNWQQTLDITLRNQLKESEMNIESICKTINQAIVNELEQEGVDKSRLTTMSATANRSCLNAVKAAFGSMQNMAVDTQRNLNRSLLPLVQENMNASYEACLNCPRGTGVFDRMKHAMFNTTQKRVTGMFEESKEKLLTGINRLIEDLVTLIRSTEATISKHLEEVYSIYWDDQKSTEMIDPDMQDRIRACRDALLPDLNKFCVELGLAQDILGIEREALDLDVMAVESLDATLQRKVDEAKEKGEIIDLCDSDEEIDDILAKLPPPAFKTSYQPIRIKADPEMLGPGDFYGV